jgi:hypothetical protein
VNELAIVDDTAVALAEHAEAIRVLGRQTAANIIEIGRRLTEAKELAGHGGWLPWLDREFGWSDNTALNYIRVYELSKSSTVADLNIPMRGLYLLAAPSTPEAARTAVVDKAADGERVSLDEVKRIVREAKREEAYRYDAQLAAAKGQFNREVAKLQLDLADALSSEQMQQAIDEALAPLQAKIKRLEDERAKQAKARTFKDEYGLRAQAIKGRLDLLAQALVITPAQLIEAETLVVKATGQPLDRVLGDMIKHAGMAKAWLDQFLALEEVK